MKIIGYALIMIAFASVGLFKNSEINHKILYSYAYFDFICLVREKIALWRLPLTKIYENLNNEELDNLGFLKTLRTQGLEKAFKSIEHKLIIDGSHLDFCKMLGTMPLTETVKLCDEEIKKLEFEIREKKAALEKKSKLYPALGILAGVATVILIL